MGNRWPGDSFRRARLEAVRVPFARGTALAFTFAAYFILASGAFLALSGKSWSFTPKLLEIWNDHFGDLTDRRLKWEIMRDLWTYYEDNRTGYHWKMIAVRASLAVVMVESAAMVVGLILVAAGA